MGRRDIWGLDRKREEVKKILFKISLFFILKKIIFNLNFDVRSFYA